MKTVAFSIFILLNLGGRVHSIQALQVHFIITKPGLFRAYLSMIAELSHWQGTHLRISTRFIILRYSLKSLPRLHMRNTKFLPQMDGRNYYALQHI